MVRFPEFINSHFANEKACRRELPIYVALISHARKLANTRDLFHLYVCNADL